jgi:hypothetical protein
MRLRWIPNGTLASSSKLETGNKEVPRFLLLLSRELSEQDCCCSTLYICDWHQRDGEFIKLGMAFSPLSLESWITRFQVLVYISLSTGWFKLGIWIQRLDIYSLSLYFVTILNPMVPLNCAVHFWVELKACN